MSTQPFPPEALAYINDVIDRLKAEKPRRMSRRLSIFCSPRITALFYGVDAV